MNPRSVNVDSYGNKKWRLESFTIIVFASIILSGRITRYNLRIIRRIRISASINRKEIGN